MISTLKNQKNEVKVATNEIYLPRTIETQLCVDIKPRNRNKELKK